MSRLIQDFVIFVQMIDQGLLFFRFIFIISIIMTLIRFFYENLTFGSFTYSTTQLVHLNEFLKGKSAHDANWFVLINQHSGFGRI